MREDGAGRPRLAFDHVQLAVEDLEEAAGRLRREHGLVALPGGRHPGRGTANMIVPLGDSYLELIAVVDPDEARRLPTSMRVAGAVAEGRTFSGWAVRTGDLEGSRSCLVAAGFPLPEPAEGARRRPDGVELRWRMQELVPDAAPSPLPFLIEWRLPPERYPGAAAAAHERRVTGVAAVRLGDPDPEAAAARLRAVLAGDLSHTVARDRPGLLALVLDTAEGPLEIG